MKILQVLPSLDVGGVERGVIDLVRAMKKRGEESVVISSGGELVAELQKMGVMHYVLPVHKKSLASLSLISKIAEIIERERIDLVHARSRVPAWLAWFAAKKTGRPFVTTCHGYYSTHLLSHVMGWGKRVIVISRVIGRHMIDDFGVPPDRISLIHRGVDLSQFQRRKIPGEAARGTKENPFRIINVGRLSPIKGHLEFIRAVHLARRQVPHLEAWIVGSEAKGKRKYTDRLLETIQQLGLESCIKLLGKRRDIPDLLAQSDLLVMPTLVPEAFGRVIIEAGAVGVPVIATRVGGVLDIIDDRENGRLVPAGDSPTMAEAMVEILKTPALAESFSCKLRQKVETQFTLDGMTEKTLQVYREVKEEKKILIFKLGAMGDLILAVPSFRMLREKFPKAHISLLVDRALAPLVSKSPYLNEVIPVDRSRLSGVDYFLKFAKRLRSEAFDVSVDLQNNKWTHLLAAFSGIKERYGFRRGALGFLLTHGDRSFATATSPVKHQFRVLSKLGIRELDETLELWPEDEAVKKMERILFGEELPERRPKLVGFVIGSSPQWPTKRWPTEYYRDLAKRLCSGSKVRVVLIGSESDQASAGDLMQAIPGDVMDLTGKTSLAELIALVNHLEVLVTGDTAPLHIASAMRKKIVAIFGPTDPKRHMPPGSGAMVLVRNLSCQPCYRGVCRNKEVLACLTHISVREVFETVQRQLQPSDATFLKAISGFEIASGKNRPRNDASLRARGEADGRSNPDFNSLKKNPCEFREQPPQ